MRVSEYFDLGRTQPSLDFVDVDVTDDIPVFVDPTALRTVDSEWSRDCIGLVQNFFSAILKAVRDGQHDIARELLGSLREPNEVHLGLSFGRSRGSALGPDYAEYIWQAISESEAVRSGILQDLEDTILMIEGIGPDRISDMTINIIRGPLIRYTQDACRYYDIPMRAGVASGPMWDAVHERWFSAFVELPVVDDERLLLVPKIIVRRRVTYETAKYYRHYLLEHLRRDELNANSALVHILQSGPKKGQRRVYKTELMEKYGSDKLAIARETIAHPDALAEYRAHALAASREPLDHAEFAEIQTHAATEPPWDDLLARMTSLDVGAAAATQYEEAIEALLTALFYPELANPAKQTHIHDGRKRIDITYDNVARRGFFSWVSQHYPAAKMLVECKNYRGDPANPELDQMSGRFSDRRGQVGLLICRNLGNKALFLQRCRDTANDGRGFVVALDDDDLRELVSQRRRGGSGTRFPLLHDRFNQLIM